jgi:hypothetical protein
VVPLNPGKNEMLHRVTTADLVKELSLRPGVKRIVLGSYKCEQINVEGPAIILEITD